MSPEQMVAEVKQLAVDWKYDVVSIGYPGLILRGQVALEPHNLAQGWMGFDFETAFSCPVRLVNDAAMQALGSYQGGVLLFLGLGTGLGSAWSCRASWCRWSLLTSHTKNERTRTTLGFVASSDSERKSGNVM